MRTILSNEEAVSELIGVILALGIAILALAVLQTTAIPVWDEELEHGHNIVVYNDFMQLRSNTFSDSPNSAPIEMGFLYPNRILLRNPTKGVSGTIVTKNQTIRVQGLVGGGVEWAGNDSVDKLPILNSNWTQHADHANKSSTAGDTLRYTFNGTNLSIDFWRTRDSGFASVSVDGVIYEQINLYSNQYTDNNGTLHTYAIVDDLDFGFHTVEVEVMGTHSSSFGGNLVAVDAFRPGVVHMDNTYPTSVISYSADNNFAVTPSIVLEHALVLKAYDGYTYTETSPLVTPGTIFLPLIQMPETSVTSIESITIDTIPVDMIELLLIDANISFETDYPDLWNNSIIPDLENRGITASLSGNNITIFCNTTMRLMMPIIVATIDDEGGGGGDNVPPTIWFSTSPPLAPTLTDKTKPLIIANYSDASGINVGSVKVYLDGVSTGSLAYSDHVNYTPSAPLVPGWHNVRVEVSDTLGNIGTLTSNNFFVVIEPWVEIVSLNNELPMVLPIPAFRGFNITVDFKYTDTNAKSYIVQINNSTDIIASITKNVSQVSGIEIPMSESILIGANTTVGLYDVWVWIIDTTGYTNSSLERDAVNVVEAQAEHLVLDISAAGLDNPKKVLHFAISNNGTSDIIIDQIIVSWNIDGGELIEKIMLTGNFWKGISGYVPAVASPSGTTLDGVDETLNGGSTIKNAKFEFNANMAGKTFTITFLLGDGSSKTIVLTP